MHAEARSRPLLGALLHLESRRIATRHGPFRVEVLRDLASRRNVLALGLGDLRAPQPLLARVHGACTAGECLAGCDCDCAENLDGALAAVAAEGRGLVFYLQQEGRGAGFCAAARGRMAVQASGGILAPAEAYDLIGLEREPAREVAVAVICRLLGVAAPLRLLTGDAEEAAALEAQGVAVRESVPFAPGTPSAASGALPLPEAVAYFDPEPLPDAPRFLRVASYLLPVRAGGSAAPLWFRVHAYLDRESGAERWVLTHGRLREPLVCLQRDALLERFALDARRRWLAAARRIAAHGAGCAVFLPVQLAGSGPALPDEAALTLMAHHVKGRRAQLLLDAADAAATERACKEPLQRRGISLAASLVLGDAT
ncbi:MAG TPA: hypothetical protein VIY27_00155 [Myxococcota bacterium]